MPAPEPAIFRPFYLALLCSMILLFSTVITAHPIYVSITEFKIDREISEMEVTITVFSDDLLAAVVADMGGDSTTFTAADSLKIKAAISHYLDNKLALSLGEDSPEWIQSSMILKVGKARTQFIRRLKLLPVVTSLQIDNRIFLELFDTQKNMIRLHDRDGRRTFALDKAETTLAVKL